jgi:phage gp29-like protein
MIQRVIWQAEAGWFGKLMEMYAAMTRTDAHLGGVSETRQYAVSLAPNEIVTPEGLEDDRKAQIAVDYMKEVTTHLRGFRAMLGVLSTAALRGFEGVEIVWEGNVPVALLDTEDVGWKWNRSRERDGGLHVQLADDSWIPCPVNKFVISSPRGFDPIIARRGVLRRCILPWVIKHDAARWWAFFAEKYGTPNRLIKSPTGTIEGDPVLQSVIDAVLAMGPSGVAAVPAEYEIELMNQMAAGSGTSQHELLANWCDSQISIAILGATLTADTSKTGAYATAKTHEEVRFERAEADAINGQEAIREDLFRPAVQFGLGEDYPIPRLIIKVRRYSARQFADILDIAVNKLRMEVDEASVYEGLGLTPPLEGSPSIGPAAAPTVITGPVTDDGEGGREVAEDERSEGVGDDRDRGAMVSRRTGERLSVVLDAMDDANQALDLDPETANLLADQSPFSAMINYMDQHPEFSLSSLVDQVAELYPNLSEGDFADKVVETMNSATVNGSLAVQGEADIEGEGLS